jgi:hypothetical protein
MKAGIDLFKKIKVIRNLRTFGIRNFFELKQHNFRCDQFPSRGWIVETIGPSGAGKTTLYKNIWPEFKDQWFSKRQIRELIEYHDPIKLFELIDRKTEKLMRLLLHKRFRNLSACEDTSISKIMKLFNFYFKEMEVDVYARYADGRRGLFSDGGLTHNFISEIVEIAQNEGKQDNFYEQSLFKFFKGRGIIHINASPEYIVENLKKRSIETPYALNDWYSHYGKVKIKEHVKKIGKEYEDFVSIAKIFGAQVLLLEADREAAVHLKSIHQYIDSLMKSEYLTNDNLSVSNLSQHSLSL